MNLIECFTNWMCFAKYIPLHYLREKRYLQHNKLIAFVKAQFSETCHLPKRSHTSNKFTKLR